MNNLKIIRLKNNILQGNTSDILRHGTRQMIETHEYVFPITILFISFLKYSDSQYNKVS